MHAPIYQPTSLNPARFTRDLVYRRKPGDHGAEVLIKLLLKAAFLKELIMDGFTDAMHPGRSSNSHGHSADLLHSLTKKKKKDKHPTSKSRNSYRFS